MLHISCQTAISAVQGAVRPEGLAKGLCAFRSPEKRQRLEEIELSSHCECGHLGQKSFTTHEMTMK